MITEFDVEYEVLKSDHFGIETYRKEHLEQENDWLKSDHFGIETVHPRTMCQHVWLTKIRPFWDWNIVSEARIEGQVTLKSDHFGIETSLVHNEIEYTIELKSDHFGIETRRRYTILVRCVWN